MLYVDQALVSSLTEVDLLRVTGFITTFLKLYQNWSASGFQISYSYVPHKLLKCTVCFFFLVHLMNYKALKQFLFSETLKVCSTVSNFHSPAQTLISALSIRRSHISHFR